MSAITIRAIVILTAMIFASGLAGAMRPTVRLADIGPKIDLEKTIPTQFGDWREEKLGTIQPVNPEQKNFLDQLYSQMLSRTYVNAAGYRIMLSIAYGGNQSDGMQVHKPEICYPAQGFIVWKNETGAVVTKNGGIPVKRLMTSLNQRHEPVTYWITVGDKAVSNSLQKKLVEMKYGLTGKIPDGLLFRVSSVDADTPAAYMSHDNFINQLLNTIPEEQKVRLVGKLQ